MYFVEMAEDIKDLMRQVDTPQDAALMITIIIVVTLIVIALVILITWLLLKANGKVFSYLRKKQGNSLKLQFMERLVQLIIVAIAIILPLAGDGFRQSILSSTAVMAAVFGFAAQDVIKNILAGMHISIYKPFEVGDRVEFDDGRAGVVEKITMRHVVLADLDTLKIVIPNSKINELTVYNYSSAPHVDRSVIFRFPVAYDSDVKKAQDVIAAAIEESPYTCGRRATAKSEEKYSPVYFLSIDDSALIMTVTVYFKKSTPTEVVKNDINSRVFEALKSNNIEIPYNYMNVLLPDGKEAEDNAALQALQQADAAAPDVQQQEA